MGGYIWCLLLVCWWLTQQLTDNTAGPNKLAFEVLNMHKYWLQAVFGWKNVTLIFWSQHVVLSCIEVNRFGENMFSCTAGEVTCRDVLRQGMMWNGTEYSTKSSILFPYSAKSSILFPLHTVNFPFPSIQQFFHSISHSVWILGSYTVYQYLNLTPSNILESMLLPVWLVVEYLPYQNIKKHFSTRVFCPSKLETLLSGSCQEIVETCVQKTLKNSSLALVPQ